MIKRLAALRARAGLAVAVLAVVLDTAAMLPLAAAENPQPADSKAETPNVVFILSDDHRFDFMGCVESSPSFLETPNLDRMAAEGCAL